MKTYRNPPAEILLSAFAPYVIGGVILFFLYKKSQSTVPAKIEEVKKSLVDIRENLPGVVVDRIMGRTEAGYITQEEATRRAKEALERKRAGFAPIIYGS